jgi:Phospholipase_D-nuclease N-terminal
MSDSQLVLLLLPIIAIQLGLTIFALWDLTRAERRVRGDSKLMWALIVIFVGTIGPLIYLAVGREDG